MRIYTRIVLDMTQDDMPVVEAESYEYDGPMALCGRDSDASGGSANGGNGEGNENEGRNGDSDGGSENSSMRGYGGFGGLGIGNPTSYGATDNPRGYEASLDRQQDRDRAVAVGKGLRATGFVTGNPLASIAGWGVELAGKYGRSRAEMSDMEKAADANGMGEGERGRSSDSDKYTNLPQGLVDYLNQNLAPKDDSYKSIADIINAARDKAGLNNTTTTTPAKPVATDYSDILNKYSDGNGLGVSSVVGSGSTQAKPYNNSKPNFQIDGSGSATGVTSAINSAPVYKPAPAAKAIDGGNMNGGTSLISGRMTLA